MKKKVSLVVVFLCWCGAALPAQKNKTAYNEHKEHIRNEYRQQMLSIAKNKKLTNEERKYRRDAAIDQYLTDKKANRIAHRRKISHAENPLLNRKRPRE
ncbi:hypothetical protein [Sediminibacterium soli]|uniref:hypothetical protein n=1 Tax=Sediminibacterium soli TaxID=2698829 RepID=UPI00137AEBEF|nr:hypothetical protein [Sediminibacterium soli]NCI45293.1 hypothetical protein [Sediminibacterium soli]